MSYARFNTLTEGMTEPAVPAANPTTSDTYAVLEHERGGREVWDCDEFGPWRLVAGPFSGPTGYARACEALTALRSGW